MTKKEKKKTAGKQRSLVTFLKAQVSAQLASLIDFALTILLATLFNVFYVYATFIGSVMGGVANCVINYRWVFQADECKKLHIALKYLLVWAGSIALNTWGTFILTEWLTEMHWVNGLLGNYVDNVFILPKIIVAILVAFFWNYHMQRWFVYRNHHFARKFTGKTFSKQI